MWHGLWIAKFNIPSFIATLSGMLIFRGLTYAILGGQTYFSYPQQFLAVTNGFLKDYLGGNNSNFHVTTFVIGFAVAAVFIMAELYKRAQQRRNEIPLGRTRFFILKLAILSAVIVYFMYVLACYKGIPIVLIHVTVIVLIYSYILNNTIIGRHVYAIGGNQKAALLSGVNVGKAMFTVYVNVAFLTAVAGLVFTARINAASPKAGEGFELDAIAACYIGGASASGGIGTIGGAMIGALVMGLLNNGMSILGIDVNVQMVVKGLVLLMAVVFDQLQKSRSRS
jgi:putative multiple sugar transport system permease protein